MREKPVDCDREAARLLQIQTGTGRPRLADRALIIAFAAFLGAFALLFWLLPDRAASETENRALRERPAFSWKALADGSFTAEFAEYMADQFPARDFFVHLKAASEAALGRGGNNGVLFGRGGTLAARQDTPNLTNLETNLAAAAHFSKAGQKELDDMLNDTRNDISERIRKNFSEALPPDVLERIIKEIHR